MNELRPSREGNPPSTRVLLTVLAEVVAQHLRVHGHTTDAETVDKLIYWADEGKEE